MSYFTMLEFYYVYIVWILLPLKCLGFSSFTKTGSNFVCSSWVLFHLLWLSLTLFTEFGVYFITVIGAYFIYIRYLHCLGLTSYAMFWCNEGSVFVDFPTGILLNFSLSVNKQVFVVYQLVRFIVRRNKLHLVLTN